MEMEKLIYEFLCVNARDVSRAIPMSKLASIFHISERGLRDIIKYSTTNLGYKICSCNKGYYAPDSINETDLKPLIKSAESSIIRIFKVGGRKELDKLFFSVYSTINKDRKESVHPDQISLF